MPNSKKKKKPQIKPMPPGFMVPGPTPTMMMPGAVPKMPGFVQLGCPPPLPPPPVPVDPLAIEGLPPPVDLPLPVPVDPLASAPFPPVPVDLPFSKSAPPVPSAPFPPLPFPPPQPDTGAMALALSAPASKSAPPSVPPVSISGEMVTDIVPVGLPIAAVAKAGSGLLAEGKQSFDDMLQHFYLRCISFAGQKGGHAHVCELGACDWVSEPWKTLNLPKKKKMLDILELRSDLFERFIAEKGGVAVKLTAAGMSAFATHQLPEMSPEVETAMKKAKIQPAAAKFTTGSAGIEMPPEPEKVDEDPDASRRYFLTTLVRVLGKTPNMEMQISELGHVNEVKTAWKAGMLHNAFKMVEIIKERNDLFEVEFKERGNVVARLTEQGQEHIEPAFKEAIKAVADYRAAAAAGPDEAEAKYEVFKSALDPEIKGDRRLLKWLTAEFGFKWGGEEEFKWPENAAGLTSGKDESKKDESLDDFLARLQGRLADTGIPDPDSNCRKIMAKRHFDKSKPADPSEWGKTRFNGDWECGKCGTLVFARRNACIKCGAARVDGQRLNGDWDCRKCGTMCFARRKECIKCGAAKEEDQGLGSDGMPSYLTKFLTDEKDEKKDRRRSRSRGRRSPPRHHRSRSRHGNLPTACYGDRRNAGRDDRNSSRNERRDDANARHDDRNSSRNERRDDRNERRDDANSRHDDRNSSRNQRSDDGNISRSRKDDDRDRYKSRSRDRGNQGSSHKGDRGGRDEGSSRTKDTHRGDDRRDEGSSRHKETHRGDDRRDEGSSRKKDTQRGDDRGPQRRTDSRSRRR